jgi:SH3-like domain-containing protein
MPFLRLGSHKGWIKVQDLEGEVLWARRRDLSSRLRCVVVKTNTAALHKAPQFASPGEDLKNLDRYTPLKRIKDQKAWIQVEDEAHNQAWIHESQVWKPVTVNNFSF